MGASWIFWNSRESATKQTGVIKELMYIDPAVLKGFADASEENQKDIFRNALRLKITNLGLFLFRNGLGVVWYELEDNTRQLDSGRLVHMQNHIKELNRANATYLWLCGRGTPSDCAVVFQKTSSGQMYYAAPFSLARWIADRTMFLKKKYLVERKSAWPSLMRAYKKILKTSKLPVTDSATGTMSEENQEDNMPDKAVLFTYCTFLEERHTKAVSSGDEKLLLSHERNCLPDDTPDNLRDNIPDNLPDNLRDSLHKDSSHEDCSQDPFVMTARQRLAYNLTNGYTDSYDCSPEIFRDMKQPFTDAIWYVTSEGAGYYKWPNDSNRNTFESVIRSKASTDYFSLFIKALYQSYTLMLLAKQIQDEIPAERIEEMDDSDYENIGRKYEEVNHFLTKSIVTSVSHIHHQNEYYIYLKKQLRIDEDAKSVSTGLEALDALQKEQRHRKNLEKIEEERKLEKQRDDEEKRRDNNLQEAMGIFSLLAIASAFVDCFDFIAKFSRDTADGWWNLISSPLVMGAEIVFCILIFLISLYAIVFIIKNRRERKKQ